MNTHEAVITHPGYSGDMFGVESGYDLDIIIVVLWDLLAP